MTDTITDERAAISWQMFQGLCDIYRHDAELCIGTVSAFLEQHSAGVPDVPLFQEQVRQDALFWASIASPHELEAYAVASMDALVGSTMASKQIKRLAAAAFRRLSPSDKASFKEWINTQ